MRAFTGAMRIQAAARKDGSVATQAQMKKLT
jgi:hypothetical protein